MSETVRSATIDLSAAEQSNGDQPQSETRAAEVWQGAGQSLRQQAPLFDVLAREPLLELDTNRLIWRSRAFVFRIALAGLLLSTLVAFLIPRRFESTSRLMPPDQMNYGAGVSALAANSGLGAQIGSGIGLSAGDILGLKSSSELFIAIMQSRTVQDDLVARFDLTRVYSDRRIEDARDDLARRTKLASDRKSGVLTIQVADRDATRAAAIAKEYSSELNRVVTELNTSSAHRERVFLQERLSQVKRDLESAENIFSEFSTKNVALDVPTQGRALIEATASLQGQLIAARTELQSLRQTYTDQNQRVRIQQARVTELSTQLNLSVSGPSGGLTGTNSAASYPSLQQLPALGMAYSDLVRNTKIQESVYQTLTQEYELAKVQEAKETPSVKILDPPDIPTRKSFPPATLDHRVRNAVFDLRRICLDIWHGHLASHRSGRSTEDFSTRGIAGRPRFHRRQSKARFARSCKR